MDNFNSMGLRSFRPTEFPEGELVLMDPAFLRALQAQRDIFPRYCIIRPSPVEGAFARRYGNPESRHYAINRKSDAGDWYPGYKLPLDMVFNLVLLSGLWGGIGFYFNGHGFSDTHDTRIHTDLRPRGHQHGKACSLLWFYGKDGSGPHYPQYDRDASKEFFNELSRDRDNR